MKTLFVAASALVVALALNLAPASAAQYSAPSTGTPHYEWQYHYTGHHPHYSAGWVMVK